MNASHDPSATLRFAEFLLGLRADGLRAEETVAASRLLADGLAVAALGASQTGPRILAALAIEAGARPVAGLIATGHRVGPADAARANGAAMHVLDYEPMWNPANHALSTTLPAALAAAEWLASASGHARAARPDGAAILRALAIGVEAQARLRLASGQLEPADLLFHPPGAVGPIGSAVAAGLLLGLDAGELRHAMGIAASRTGGIIANVGSMTKALHCGQAAAAGLESAMMAARGFTADADALFSPRGYGMALYGRRFALEELAAPCEALHIVEPGPAYKLYPSQYGTHFVITAALEARAKAPAGAAFRRVRILSPPMPYVDRPTPASGLAGKFSFQYAAAVALLDGAVTVESFTDSRRFAADVVRLLPRIEIRPDPAREGRFDRLAIDVEAELEDGMIVAGRCDGPPGIWGRPAEAARLRAKAEDLMGRVFGPEGSRPLIRDLDRFDQLGPDDVLDLLSRIASEPEGWSLPC